MRTAIPHIASKRIEPSPRRAPRRAPRRGLAMVELAMALPMFAVIFLVLLTVIVVTSKAVEATYNVRGMEWAHRDDIVDPNAFVDDSKVEQWKRVLRIMPESLRGKALGEPTTERSAVRFDAPLPSMFEQETVVERQNALLHDAWDSRTIKFDVKHERLVFGNRTAEFLTKAIGSNDLLMTLDVFTELTEDKQLK